MDADDHKPIRWRGEFRPDIEGLRALAVICVLLAHGGLGAAAGGYVGVDVFYVISGFLITGLLLRELESKGTIGLIAFYGRRARRLLPMAALVIGVTVVIAYLIFSPARREVVAGDAVASSLYVANWRYALQSTDYFGAASETSPLQHYWTLAVEEQFYVLWPVLLLGIAFLLRNSGARMRLGALIFLIALSAASLAYSVWYTSEAPAPAYFSTLTRAWELALGAILAVVAIPRLGRWPALAAGLFGFGAIVAAALIYTPSTPYPSVAALLPVLGACALIVAGSARRAPLPSRALATPPARYIGRISYGIYLWHWPILIFAAEALGPLSGLESAAAIALAIGLAALSYEIYERPITHHPALRPRAWRSIGLGAACTLVGITAAVALSQSRPEIQVASADEVQGAAALDEQKAPQREARMISPDPLDAASDRGRLFDDGCLVEREETESRDCTYVAVGSESDVVLFGDSHALHFFPAIERMAKGLNWRVTGLTKAGCPAADVLVHNGRLGRAYDECPEWRENALRRIERDRPDAVIVSSATYFSAIEDGKRLEGERNSRAMQEGFERTFRRLRATGAKVIVIGDIPHAPFDVSDCVSGELDSLDECAFDYDERRNTNQFDRRAARAVPGVKLIDLDEVLCPKGTCRAVIGDALVYRGSNHLTATFARTLGPIIRAQLPVELAS